MTEAEARAALRAFVAAGELERWIAAQRWEAIPGGWTVAGGLQGWRSTTCHPDGYTGVGFEKRRIGKGRVRDA